VHNQLVVCHSLRATTIHTNSTSYTSDTHNPLLSQYKAKTKNIGYITNSPKINKKNNGYTQPTTSTKLTLRTSTKSTKLTVSTLTLTLKSTKTISKANTKTHSLTLKSHLQSHAKITISHQNKKFKSENYNIQISSIFKSVQNHNLHDKIKKINKKQFKIIHKKIQIASQNFQEQTHPFKINDQQCVVEWRV
jgi:hypothetical protein